MNATQTLIIKRLVAAGEVEKNKQEEAERVEKARAHAVEMMERARNYA